MLLNVKDAADVLGWAMSRTEQDVTVDRPFLVVKEAIKCYHVSLSS